MGASEEEQYEDSRRIKPKITREELEAKLKEAQERLARYEGYQKLMEETGVSQLSITDADAKLMKNGRHLFPAERDTESGWGVCALLPGV